VVGAVFLPSSESGVALMLALAASAAFAVATRSRPLEPSIVGPATTPTPRHLHEELTGVGHAYHDAPFPVRLVLAPVIVLVGVVIAVGLVLALMVSLLWLPFMLVAALVIVLLATRMIGRGARSTRLG
jgi:uncharacterized membrane protein